MPEETPTDTSEKPVSGGAKDKRMPGTMLVIVLLAAALGLTGYLSWQLHQTKQLLLKQKADKIALERKLAECKDDSKKTCSAADSSGDLPVVIFSPGGLFTAAEKAEITTKLLNPYRAWHHDQGDGIVSIHVQQDSHVPGQYVVDAIYDGKVYEGFLYGSLDAATQDWWFPECLDACEFTPAFRAAYPEVVAASEDS